MSPNQLKHAFAAAAVVVGLLAAPALVPGPAAAQSGFPQCDVPVDVMFLFDTTGSMGGVIASAQAGATQIMNNVVASVPNTQFGVANYKDYVGVFAYPGYTDTYGGFGDYPWQLNQAITSSTAAVQTAINGLSASGGADIPESLTRAADEVRNVNWRTGAIRIVVLFADAPPHDLDFNGQNTGGDPGPNAVAGDGDDLDFETVIGLGAAAGLRFITVDSGGGFAAPYFQFMASQTDGAYALLGGDFVNQVTQLILGIAPQPAANAHAMGALAQVSVPANPVVKVAPVAAGPATGASTAVVAHAPFGLAGSFVTAVNDGAATTLTAGLATSKGNSTIAEASVLGGLVYARELHAVAQSTTDAGGSAATTSDSSFGLLIVNGNPVPLPVSPNTMIPLPGVGVLILHEVKTGGTPGKASEVLVNMIHLVVDNAQMRGDVIVGRAYAGSTCGATLGGVLATFDNDAGTGGDAANTPAGATVLSSPAVVQGRLLDSDSVDHYAVAASPGEKVHAVMIPSSRATGDAHPLPAVPTVGAALPDFNLFLLEPVTFATREDSQLPFSAPERVELNVDKAGLWVLRVQRAATSVGGNYTLAVTVTPINYPAQNDALSGGDAPDACAPALPLSNGVWPGVLRENDPSDWYRASAAIGDLLAVTLKPTEDPDGADFDLFLYDAACNLLLSSTLGKGIVPKGTPDFVTLAPVAFTSDYRVEVRRIDGVGAYYLTVAVQDPQPTVGPLDAESSGDAGSDPTTANPVSPPAVLQGRFPDGDLEDWYSFPVPSAGQRIVVTMTPQTGSNFDLVLVRPTLTTAGASTLPASVPESIVFTADLPGTWFLRVVRLTGGGDYVFDVVVTP